MMAPPQESRHATPPHYPMHGVHMTPEAIEAIIGTVFPASRLVVVAPLPSLQSYNNRIYFLTIEPVEGAASAETLKPEERELVLKLNGRFFGGEKVQNEVACLRLLQAYCPNAPVPRVLAWSEDGKETIVPSSNGVQVYQSKEPGVTQSQKRAGWVLMTRVPGQAMSAMELDDPTKSALGRQLADIVASWRRSIPMQKHCGSISFRDGLPPDIVLPGISMVVRGIVGENIPGSRPITSAVEYHRTRLEDKLRQLETEHIYSPNKHLAPVIREFITKTLPRLSLFKGTYNAEENSFVFTHYDLSPRNILLSGEPLQITGIIDFEFSGFLPTLEEFVNDYVNNAGDWAEETYTSYLARLEELGVMTPLKSVNEHVWQQACLLETILGNVAPYWLPGDRNPEEVAEAFRKCELDVRRTLDRLHASILQSSKPAEL